MTMESSARMRAAGRLAGALYLVVVVTGMFCLGYVPSQTGDSLADAAAHADLFRAGIAAFLVMQVAFLLLPLALYRVLADVDRGAAVLMVAFAAVSVPIGLAALTHQWQALALLPETGVQASAAAQAAYTAYSEHYDLGLRVTSLFWGLWLLPYGWLVVRSGRLPRVLGLLLLLGGIGYVTKVFGSLVPGFPGSPLSSYATMPAALGEIGSALWLLVFGARTGRAAASGSPA